MTDGDDQTRLSAILAADVVGYTRLMEKDTKGTVAAWKKARADSIDPTISKYSGRIVKHTGDGFLAEFNTVQDAVNCAVDLQEELAACPLDFRMGVNLGDIIDDGEDIHGEGVNIAARIEALAEPGGICVTRGVYDQVSNRVEHSFVNMGDHAVKHVTRPVGIYRVEIGGVTVPESSDQHDRPLTRKTQFLKRRHLVSIVATLMVFIVGVSYLWLSFSEKTSDRGQFHLPDRPSIAVLPFASFSNERKQEFLSDGVTEDIITQLARNSELTVLARTATFAFKGSGLSAKEIADKLGVHYVLEGSVRRAGKKLRISAQLIDSKSGNLVWAEKYDSSVEAIFQAQDDIVDNIVGILFSEIRETEKNKILRRPPNTLDVYEVTLRGVALKHRLNPQDSRRAREELTRAVELDPNYAPAWLYLGWVEGIAIAFQWIEGLDKSHLKDAIKKIERAIELDPTLATAYQALGILKSWEGDAKSALQAARRSVELGPGDADNLLFFGRALASVGQFDEAVVYARRAVSLNPSRPIYYDAGLSRILWGQGSYEEANGFAINCLARAPGYTQCLIFLIVSYWAMDDTFAASKALSKLLKHSPNLTVEDAVSGVGFPGDSKANSRLSRQLTEAGLPL